MPKKGEAREARENHIKENADYFTVVRYLGPRAGYERHERPTLIAARDLAVELAVKMNSGYLIYAVAGIHDTWVENVTVKDARERVNAKATSGSKKKRTRL
jgi:hypothetical protein